MFEPFSVLPRITKIANYWIGPVEAHYLQFKILFFVHGCGTTNRIEDPRLIVSECTFAEKS